MAFKVNYDSKTGTITSYQEGGEASDNEVPAGCETLVFEASFPQMFNENGTILMKVDVDQKQLVFLRPIIVPQPIG